MIETARLTLRPWRAADEAPFAGMMADPAVADWLGGVLDPEQAAARIEAYQLEIEAAGFGRLVIERRADGSFLGYCGLSAVRSDIALAGGVEIGWALVPDAWGQGYVTEAAQAVMADGFTRIRLPEILAYTTVGNLRSQAVMGRLGMSRQPARDFDHPLFPAGHPLCRHLVFAKAE